MGVLADRALLLRPLPRAEQSLYQLCGGPPCLLINDLIMVPQTTNYLDCDGRITRVWTLKTKMGAVFTRRQSKQSFLRCDL